MSVLAIVLIALGGLVVICVLGGLVVARRRRHRPGSEQRIEQADQALQAARAADRGWDRDLLHDAARRALAVQRPGLELQTLQLVLVDDRPGVEEDRAHFMATSSDGTVRIVLARDASGAWGPEQIA